MWCEAVLTHKQAQEKLTTMMMKNPMKLLLLAVLLLASTVMASAQKTVHVRGYTRKDGTVVSAHDRAAPGTSSRSSSRSASSRIPSSAIYSQSTRTSDGRIRRSSRAKHDFMRMSPCPSTGKCSGGCRGYVVDHIKPLACGGDDTPSNMQWQTKEAAKVKDKWERHGCR